MKAREGCLEGAAQQVEDIAGELDALLGWLENDCVRPAA